MSEPAPPLAAEPAPEPVASAAPVASTEPAWPRPNAPALAAVALLTLVAFGGGWLAARYSGHAARADVSEAAAAREAGAALRAVQALEARVARLESEGALVARVSASGLAVVSLTAAAENPTGFATAVAAARRVLPASPDLIELEKLAERGAPTRAGLVEAFPSVAARARNALRANGGGQRLDGFSRTLDRFFSRDTPEPRGLSPESVLARAKAHLDGGDLSGAADVVGNLPPPALEVFGPWIADVRRRTEIERRLAAVRLMALGQFAAVPPGPAQPAASQ
jgi:hypothetical protein